MTALEDWDKAYGVTLLEHAHFGPIIKFRSLPQNLDQLCWEIRKLSPDLPTLNENELAARARWMASQLRAKKTISIEMQNIPAPIN